jgi:hypothetical protein
VGLNLTGADHVIHLDPWWNPAVERQATDRAHRIGQTKPVVVYKLVARDTVEEKILELQARKQALFDATVDAEKMLTESLTREDLEAVFAPSGPTESVGTDLAEESGGELDSPLAGVLTPLRAHGERGGRGPGDRGGRAPAERGGGGNAERANGSTEGAGSRARPPRRRTRGGGGGRPTPPGNPT